MFKTLALLTLVAGSAHAFDFRGIELGKRLPDGLPQEMRCVDSGDCNGAIDVLDFGGSISVISVQDKVSYLRFEFSRVKFDELDKALTAKFGKAGETEVIAKQNSFGARIRGRVKLWKARDGSTMMLDEVEDASSASLTLNSKIDRPVSAGI